MIRGQRQIRRMLACGVALMALNIGAAYAQERKIRIEVPPQALSQSLKDVARQTGVDVMFSPEAVSALQAPRISGELTAKEAIRRLIGGTSLEVAQDMSGALVVRAKASAATGNASAAGELQAGQGPAASAGAEGDDREIVVTGSIIRGAAPSGANLIVLGREDLDNTGRGTLAEAIQTVPQVHGGGANNGTTRTGIGAAPNQFGGASNHYGMSSLNLRGLGVEETLTLVNGRRLAPAGYYGAIGDISALPMAAVERVEILADGASATYGADAMAGVVNIIMNRRFEGAETRLRAGLETRSGQPEFQASQTFGWAFDRGNILLSADYARRDAITAKGRPYAASADLRPFGGSDHRGNLCSPGNIVDSTGRVIGAIPAGQDGTALTPDQIRWGETNKCDIHPISSHLTPETKKGSLYFAGSFDVTDRLRLSTDIIAARRNTTNISSYHFSDFLTVPVSNAYRQMNGLHGSAPPLNQNISISYLFTEIDPETYEDDVWSLTTSAGVEYSITRDWQLSFYGSYGLYDSRSKSLDLDTRPASQGGTLNQALASSDPATAFNPFGDGSTNSQALVESFLHPFHSLQESEYWSTSLTLDGTLLNLPAGPLKVALGGDYRRESFSSRERDFYPNLTAPGYLESSAFDAGRDAAAAYVELSIPLISERNAVIGARRLSASLSGRYDHYSDFGGTFNPKAGVTWVPVEGLILKGSYGTSFKAPLLRNLYDPSSASVYSLQIRTYSGAPDNNGDGTARTMYILGGNPDLGPEKGESWTAGVEIEPAALPGLRVHATYFNLHFKGRFAQALSVASVFANPAAYQGIAYFPLPPQSQVDHHIASVDRLNGVVPPIGSIEAIIDGRTLNFASQVMDGIDAGASYRWDGLGGTFSLSGNISYLSRYKSRLGSSVTVSSYLDNVGLPVRWKIRGGASWTDGIVSLSGWINHTDSYTNKQVRPYEPVSSYTTVDLSLQAQLDGWMSGLVGKGASLSVYVTNLLDQAPPFVNNPWGVGYDGANADPIGRRLAVQLTKRW